MRSKDWSLAYIHTRIESRNRHSKVLKIYNNCFFKKWNFSGKIENLVSKIVVCFKASQKLKIVENTFFNGTLKLVIKSYLSFITFGHNWTLGQGSQKDKTNCKSNLHFENNQKQLISLSTNGWYFIYYLSKQLIII